MWIQKGYFVYTMGSHLRVLYVGITSNLPLMVWQHKTGAVEGFTSKYKVTQLVYYESLENVRDAIRREKEIKGWIRQKKIALIEGVNPKWRDLSAASFNRQSDEKLRKMFTSMNRIGRKHIL
jgi:putative endonuclease